MKKIVVVGITAWLILALSLGTFAFQNEPDGFRGLKWGDPVTEEMKYDGGLDELVYYVLPDDKMFIGNVEFDLICYSFYEGRFYGVDLYFDGEDNWNLLAMICKYRFGEEVEQTSDELIWTGQKAEIGLSSKSCYFWLRSIVIRLEMSDPSRKAKKEAEKAKKEAEKAEGDW